MIRIVYDPVRGIPIEDGRIEDIVKEMLETEDMTLNTSSLLLVLALGQRLTKEKVAENGLELYFRPVSKLPEREEDAVRIDFMSSEEELPTEFKNWVDKIGNGFYREETNRV